MATNLSFANSLFIRFLNVEASDAQRLALTQEIADLQQDDPTYTSFDATADFVNNQFDTQHSGGIEQHILDYYAEFSQTPTLTVLLNWTDQTPSINSNEASELKGLLVYDVYAQELNELPNPLSIDSPSQNDSLENEPLDYTVTATGVNQQLIIYSLLTDFKDSDFFNIDARSGKLSFKEAPDFEDKSSYTVIVVATNTDTLVDTFKEITIDITGVNEAPIFTNSSTSAIVDEDSTQVFYTATASDPENDTLTFAIGSKNANDNNLFSIGQETGALKFRDKQDFEADENSSRVYVVDITVTDSNIDKPVTQQILVSLNNINEAPEFTSATTATANESSTEPFYTATAIDPDGDELSFALGNQANNDNSLFVIDEVTGALKFIDEQDIQADDESIFLVDIEVTDNIIDQAITQQVSVSLNNTNDAPEFTSATTATAPENSTQAFYIATAADPDDDPLTFSINNQEDNDNRFFIIDAETGQLALKDKANFEANNASRIFLVDIAVTDNIAEPVVQQISVTLRNINETPIFTSAATASVDENSTQAFYTATASDPERNTLTFAINNQVDKDNSLFIIDAASGQLRFKNLQDFEAPGNNNGNRAYLVDITVTDGSAKPPTLQEVRVTINDISDPVLTLSALDGSGALTVTEGDIAEYKVALTSGNIKANDTLSFTLEAQDGVAPFGAVNPDDFSGLNVSGTPSYTFIQTFDQEVVAGVEIFSFSLQTEEDNELEETEAFSIELNSATLAGASLPSPVNVVSTGSPLITQIENKRAPELTLSALDGSDTLIVTEGEIAAYKVTLSHGHIQVGETLSFTLDALDGLSPFGAVNPDDFSGLNVSETTTYTFTQTFDMAVTTGDEIFSFSLLTEEDNELEDTEAFSIELNAATLAGASLPSPLDVVGIGSPLVTQIENLRAPEITLSALDGGGTLTVTEGEIADYKVTLSHGHIQAGETLSFTLDALDGLPPFGAVNPDDFGGLNVSDTMTYTFTQTFDESVTTGDEIFSFSLQTEEDNELEDTEAFSIELNSASLSGASLPSPLDVVSLGSPLITQIENLRAPELTLSALDGSDTLIVTEGEIAEYKVTLSHGHIQAGETLSFTLDALDGLPPFGAVNPDDFSELNVSETTTFTFTQTFDQAMSTGDEIFSFSLLTEEDNELEDTEAFSIELNATTLSGVSLPSSLDVVSNGSPLITQIENQIRTYTFALSGDSNATEGNNANYSIHLTGDNILRGSIVELVLQTSDGDALNPDDFSDLVGANYDTDTKTLTLSGPVSSSDLDPIANLSIAIVNDRLNESAEDFRVELVSATVDSQAANISGATVTTTIAANDFDTTAPSVIANQIAEYLENRLSSEVLYQVQANDITTDPHDFESGVANYQIDSGNSAGYFQIDAIGNIRLTVAGTDGVTNDFESLPNTFTLGISAIDNVGNQSAITDVTLNVIDVIEIFAFTAGIDSLIGSDFDDTFIADNTIDQVTSITDSADGGGGDDTLLMTVDSAGDIVFPSVVKNIENVIIDGSDGGLLDDVDFSLLSSVSAASLSTFDLNGSRSPTVTFDSGQDLVLQNIIDSSLSGIGSLNIRNNIGQTGLNITVNTLSSSNAPFLTNLPDYLDTPNINFTGSELVTLNILSTGAPSSFTLQQTETALNRINFSGDQRIAFTDDTFGSSASSSLIFDAGSNSAGITSHIDFDQHTVEFIGGAGDDLFNAEDDDIIDAKSGFDVVRFNKPVSALNFLNDDLVNVEKINTYNTDTNTINDAGVSERTTFDFNAQTENLFIEPYLINLSDNHIAPILIGGTGNDRIEGWGNSDELTGNSGADTFGIGFTKYQDPETLLEYVASDIITDFIVAEGDKITSDFEGYVTFQVTNLENLQTIVSSGIGASEQLEANSGVVIIDNSNGNVKDALSLTTVEVARYLGNIQVFDPNRINVTAAKSEVMFENDDSLFYLLISDGADSGLYRADAAAGINNDLTIDADELTLIATIEGISNAGSLSGSFVDFPEFL